MIGTCNCGKYGLDWLALGEIHWFWCGDDECLTKMLVQIKSRSLPLAKSVRMHMSQVEDQNPGVKQ